MSQLTLMQVYQRLYARFGPQHWWPASSPYEVVVGAILTQNTAWQNVEKAIARLAAAKLLSPPRLQACSEAQLQEYIRPAGYFRQKAARLQEITADLLHHAQGDVVSWLSGPLQHVRHHLLGLRGIGPETADSILLYAGGHATFVVDAYTIRIFSRLGYIPETARYAGVQALFHEHLPPDPALFNEYHALIVRLAKEHCAKRRPQCLGCPLAEVCAYHAPFVVAARG